MDPRESYIEQLIGKQTTELMDLSFDCICGERHAVPMKHLSMRKGAVEDVAPVMTRLGISGKGGLVFDRAIADAVVAPVRKRLAGQGLDLRDFPEGDGSGVIPPEIEVAGALASRIGGAVDYLVSVGSGVISDLTKQAANLLQVPYVLVGTAPSMNGYTSSMAALSNHGIKQTLTVEPARAIFTDLDILKESPVEMVRSGLGDIVSKSVCNADWKLSQWVKGTYFCPVPFRITDKTEPRYLNAAAEIGARSDNGIRELTDGVLRSGLSMTVIGTSTPSSGAEHLLSHYWDLVSLMEGSRKHLHGVQVGVATVIMQRVYEYLGNFPARKKINLKKLAGCYPDLRDLEAFMDNKFGDYAEGVKEQYGKKHLPWEQKRRELERILDGWEQLWDDITPYIRPPGPVEQALAASGAAHRYTDLGMSRDQALDALVHARLIRWRYTILDLAADLGLLEEMAQKLL